MMTDWSRTEELPVPPLPDGPTVLPPAPEPSLGGGGIRLDFSRFYTTVAGMLLLVEFVFGIICLACASPAQHPATGWFLFVAAISFIFTILWIINYMFNVMGSVAGVNWNAVELVSFAILAVLYFTAAAQLNWEFGGRRPINFPPRALIWRQAVSAFSTQLPTQPALSSHFWKLVLRHKFKTSSRVQERRCSRC
ncbi:protein MAL2-like [Cloeon dipterum]|uniref:protein MAL2-like n=1 Tax=Cloeon dipterum TaxID=197152 RepID=UPI0032202475